MPETTFHEYFAPPLPTIPDPSIKGIEFRLYVLPHLLFTPPFRWPEFQHRSDYPDHPIPANQIRWDTIVPACQRWTATARAIFNSVSGGGNSMGRGWTNSSWEACLINCYRTDNRSPFSFPSSTMPLFLTSFHFYLRRFATFRHRHCFLLCSFRSR